VSGIATLDARATYRQERLRFARSRSVERTYASRLFSVARQIGAIIRGFAPDGVTDLSGFFQLRETLNRYAEILLPWSRKVAEDMVNEVARKDASAWEEHGRKMGRALRKELAHAPTGEILKQYLADNVDLITSLPRVAAERVHKLTLEGLSQGVRANEIAKEILRSGHVSASRAQLIARTEVARTASGLTMARAKYVGSTQYSWETARDSDVRPLHRKLQGKVFDWDDPPVTGENGERSLPGGIYRCRCVAYPIIPDLE
jgi:SPP1 gp7 family putative phage head morphogenesis protein